jgi:outer membrane protein TolC
VLARRHDAGTASGYERVRLELEAELGASELRELTARAQIEQTELALLLGLEPERVALHGQLDAREREHEGGGPRSLAFARDAIDAAQAAQDSASSAWWPSLEAQGGLRLTEGQGATARGYVAGVTLDLPVFSRGQDVRA